ncbi:uncharacterized protein [Anas acuta]|uniref:uncharacterized protein isoform X2 n=1 Tax=Anas acuta TaxID=28680 RepID=UPI0035C89542
MSRSAGRYTCGYKKRNEMKQRRRSALIFGRILNVPGAGAGVTTKDIYSSPGNVVSSPASPSPPAPHALIPHALPQTMVLAVVAIGLVLLAAGSWFAIRKGVCRGRCPRQQHVDSPQMETTDHGEVTCEYYLLPWRNPTPVSGGILPLHFPLGYTNSLPVHQGHISLQHFMSYFFLACRAWLLAAQGTWQHSSAPRDKAHLLGGSFHTGSSLRLHFPFLSLCFCPFFSFSSVSFLLQELHKARHSKESCCSVSLHCWGKHFIAHSETTGSSQGRMLWLCDRLQIYPHLMCT